MIRSYCDRDMCGPDSVIHYVAWANLAQYPSIMQIKVVCMSGYKHRAYLTVTIIDCCLRMR